MIRSLKKLSIVAATTATALLHIFSGSASAFTINQGTNNLLNELLGTTTGLSNFSVSTTGDANAFGTFSNDPFGLNSGIILSTGNAVDVGGTNTSSATSTNLAGLDSITLDISFDADSTVDKLFFNYIFGSEEFLEFSGSSFNDAFSLSLNGTNLALLNNGDTVTINNLTPSSNPPYSPDFIDNTNGAVATQLDGFTKTLTFEGALLKNASNVLSINIKDVGDSALDSAVLIQGNSLSTIKPPTSVPEPGTIIGLLSVGAVGALTRKRKQA